MTRPPLGEGFQLLLGLPAFAPPGSLQLPAQLLLLLVEEPLGVGMHGHGGIAEHGLRPGGGDVYVLRLTRLRVDYRVLEVPEVSLDGFVIDLVVGDGSLKLGVPVDQALAAINQTVLEELEKRVANGLAADFVQGEAHTPPVAGATHQLQLLDDAFLVLVLPLPDTFNELIPSEVVPGESLFLEDASLHDGLGGDAGVVHAGLPQGVVFPHAVPADEDVLQRIVNGVPEVQRSGNVRQGNPDHKAPVRRAIIPVGTESTRRLPYGVHLRFHLFGIVDLFQFDVGGHERTFNCLYLDRKRN